MTNLVNFEVLGNDFSVEVVGELSEQQVRDQVTTKMAKEFVETFRIKSVTQVLDRKPKKSLYETYADGFRNLLSFPDSPARNAEATLSKYIDEALPAKAPAQ